MPKGNSHAMLLTGQAASELASSAELDWWVLSAVSVPGPFDCAAPQADARTTAVAHHHKLCYIATGLAQHQMLLLFKQAMKR